MHGLYHRLNNLSALLSSCVLALLGAIALSSFLFTADPKGLLDVSNVKVGKETNSNFWRHRFPGDNRHFRQRNHEFTFVKFNATADLRPLFNWNTKQLFVYVGAEFTSADGTKNDVVIWDRIIRRKEDAVIRVKGKNKYALRDMAKTFKSVTPAHYTLKYNVMPYVGVLTYGEAARTLEPVAFPPSKDTVS